jgi:hypothetical protein
MPNISGKSRDESSDIINKLDNLQKLETTYSNANKSQDKFTIFKIDQKAHTGKVESYANPFTALWKFISSKVVHLFDGKAYTTTFNAPKEAEKLKGRTEIKTLLSQEFVELTKQIKELRKSSSHQVDSETIRTIAERVDTIERRLKNTHVVDGIYKQTQQPNTPSIAASLVKEWGITQYVLQAREELPQKMAQFQLDLQHVDSFQTLEKMKEKSSGLLAEAQLLYTTLQTDLPPEWNDWMDIVEHQIDAKKTQIAGHKLEVLEKNHPTTTEELIQKKKDYDALAKEIRSAYKGTVPPDAISKRMSALAEGIRTKASELTTAITEKLADNKKTIAHLADEKTRIVSEKLRAQDALLEKQIKALSTLKGPEIKSDILQNAVLLLEKVLELQLQQSSAGDFRLNHLKEINKLANLLKLPPFSDPSFTAKLRDKLLGLKDKSDKISSEIETFLKTATKDEQKTADTLAKELEGHTIIKQIAENRLPSREEVQAYIAKAQGINKEYAILFLNALDALDKRIAFENKMGGVNDWKRVEQSLLDGASALNNLVTIETLQETRVDSGNQRTLLSEENVKLQEQLQELAKLQV